MSTRLVIPDMSLEQVWAAICDFKRHAEYMPDVLEVKYLERGEDEALSSWRVLLNGSELEWVERDVFHPNERLVFDQTEGDLEVFRGCWSLTSSPAGVEVVLDIEFDLGIPSLAAVLDPIGINAIQNNSRSMLSALASRGTATGG